ncbi:extracellular solute-binding protein [Nonomuraea polychroma]|uniref:extracellular solute-binding protein n=1 Tax=Nonomuraea polychroma TaxID=46176 RepID=UPI003D932A97
MDAVRFADYASVGALEPYGDKISHPDDFYPTLRTAFTYNGTLYCAPKDFSTLALIINQDLWSKGGLSDADVPATWEQLTSVSRIDTSPSEVIRMVSLPHRLPDSPSAARNQRSASHLCRHSSSVRPAASR